ncbi:wings apart-like protein [Diplodia corticola]|uniref:Wings apart-like protein n=1 Tax=Diplodia corticola TaxID=236234 RepID=A0A1J9REB4_9PEZI|nr:wings apart-like protein [Diplodia corticola]OJD38872.1 wings apart-like protein [Diplodia corticola]
MDFPQRRKKAATYGKASRNTGFKLFNEAPSPEKPRLSKPSWTASREYNISSRQDVAPARDAPEKAKADSMSIFDMPSSDEDLSRPSKPAAKKLPTRKTAPQTVAKAGNVSSEDSASEQLHKEVAAAEAKKVFRERSPSVSRHAEKPVGKKASTSGNQVVRRDPVVLIRGTRPEMAKQPSGKRSLDLVETSEDDINAVAAVNERPNKSIKSVQTAGHQRPELKHPATGSSTDELAGPSQKDNTKPAKKARPTTVVMGIRTARLQKNELENAPTSQTDALKTSATSATSATQAIRLARARRSESNPMVSRVSVQKGKSAPTLLQKMLPSPETKPSSPAESLQSPPSPDLPSDDEEEDDEAPTPATPPGRTSKSPFGTVTPRQHKAWSKLLDEDDAVAGSPSALNLNELKIVQSVKSRKTMLQRSSSDMTHTSGNRRRRLIDTLKQDTDSEESDEDESMTDTDETTFPKVEKSSHNRAPAGLSSRSSQCTGPNSSFSQEATSSQPSVPGNAGPKLTYARTRSYLNESSLEDELLLGLPSFENLGPSRRAPAQADLDELEDGTSGMRNIHELRAAGTARRVVDDIENLLDDIEEKKVNSLSRRRSALMELCAKLTDKSYVSRMVDHSLDSRLFHFCGTTTDPILGFFVACAMKFMVLAEAPKTSVAAMYSAGCLRTLAGLLKYDSDITKIARERRTNMSKVAQGMLGDFRSQVVKSIWPEEQLDVVSPRAVALKSLESVVRRLRESGNSEDILGFRAFADVAAISKEPAHKLASGSASTSDAALLELTLSILESGSLNASAWTNSSTDADASMGQLASSIDAVISTGSSLTDQLEALSLRLTLNLTNNNPEVCNVFARPTLIQNLLRSIDNRCRALGDPLDEEEHIRTLDRLILTLGAMINLAEFSNEARVASMRDGDDLLNSLVRAFLEGMERAAQADSMEESQSSVAYGYLAVLLGNLCQNWAVREKVRARLPHQRLDVLIHAVEEFIFVHQKVDKEAFDGEEGREVWANYTARLQGVIDRLQGRQT